jgi:hypothetical protein
VSDVGRQESGTVRLLIGTGGGPSAGTDEATVAAFVFGALARVRARLASPENWRAVVRLADLLVKHRRIEGPTAERVWRGSRRDATRESGRPVA